MTPTPPVGGTEQNAPPAQQFATPAPPQYTPPSAPQYTPPAPQYTPPAQQYTPPPAPVATPRAEPRYTPPAYTPPKLAERSEPETPRPAPMRPRLIVPEEKENWEERSERNRIAKPAPRIQRSEEDDYTDHPWNRPVAKGVPPCGTRDRASVCTHKVDAGETLSSIAKEHYGFAGPRTLAKITAANPGMHPDRIYIGQVVYLPCNCGGGAAVQRPEPERETASRNAYPIRSSHEAEKCIPVSAY